MTPLTVLTSAVGLGAYVAALLHHQLLRDAGHRVDLEVVERTEVPFEVGPIRQTITVFDIRRRPIV